MPVFESHHPLVKHKLGLLRRKDLPVHDFRRISNEIAAILMMDACEDLPTQLTTITGWQGNDIQVPQLKANIPTLVPILRAGMGMLDGCLQVLPTATVSVVGLYRDETTLKPVAYFDKIVQDVNQRTAIIIDPMLATGGSLLATIELLKNKGCQSIKGLFLVASPEGITNLNNIYPEVECRVASLDEKLNDQGYILPGLGDAGDKIFGTL